MSENHRPAEFDDVLNSPVRPLIIGGQAVNIWAEFYAATNPGLAALRPFVSKDADIFGDRETAEKLARTSGWKVKYFHEPRTFAVAVLSKDAPGRPTLTVEVLREVRGLTRRELEDSDLVELRPGQVYRIPSPIRLLKAKLANLREIRPLREQDVHHVLLLVPLANDYLHDQLRHVRAGTLSERQWVNAYHELRKVIDDPSARRCNDTLGLNLPASLPVSTDHEGLPKIAALFAPRPAKKRNGSRLSR